MRSTKFPHHVKCEIMVFFTVGDKHQFEHFSSVCVLVCSKEKRKNVLEIKLQITQKMQKHGDLFNISIVKILKSSRETFVAEFVFTTLFENELYHTRFR